MKKLDFKVYERPESTLEDFGTVREQVGANGTIGVIEKNLNNPDKRLALLLKNENGESLVLSCSKAVSDLFRAKKIRLPEILEMRILVNEEGVPFISSQATAIHEFKVSKIKKSTATVQTSTLTKAEVDALLELAV